MSNVSLQNRWTQEVDALSYIPEHSAGGVVLTVASSGGDCIKTARLKLQIGHLSAQVIMSGRALFQLRFYNIMLAHRSLRCQVLIEDKRAAQSGMTCVNISIGTVSRRVSIFRLTLYQNHYTKAANRPSSASDYE